MSWSVNCHSFVDRRKSARKHQFASVGMSLFRAVEEQRMPLGELNRMSASSVARAFQLLCFSISPEFFDKDRDNSITLR